MTTLVATGPRRLAVDKLGVLIAIIAVAAALLPFAAFRANRIVAGQGRSIFEALPGWEAGLLAAALAGAILVALLRTPNVLRLIVSLAMLGLLCVTIGHAATYLTPEGDRLARVSPGGGFWLGLFAFALLAADSFTRLKLAPWLRILTLLLVAAAIALLLWSGTWNSLSILKEYANRADAFWREGQTHIALALGSLAAATVVGIPLGILCQRVDPLRAVGRVVRIDKHLRKLF
jgi:osmoprotectant transport system permease protein